MSADDVRLAIAARAAGEEMPGVDSATLDRRLREEQGLGEERAALERTVVLLGRAGVPCEERRIAAVRARIALARRARWGSAALAAAILVVVGTVVLRRPPPPVHAPAGVTPAPVFSEVFAGLTSTEPAVSPPTRLGGDPGEPKAGRAGLLVPFAAQMDLVLLAPSGGAFQEGLVAARFRRKAPGVRPFSFAWLEFSTPGGPLVVLTCEDSPAAASSLASLPLPAGWRSVVRRAPGALVLVAAHHIAQESLAALAQDLEPVLR